MGLLRPNEGLDLLRASEVVRDKDRIRDRLVPIEDGASAPSADLVGKAGYAPVFHDLQDGQFVVVADDPAGERTVEVTLDAIVARQDRT